MTRKAFILLLLTTLAAPLAACGKKGDLEPPASGGTDDTRERSRPSTTTY